MQSINQLTDKLNGKKLGGGREKERENWDRELQMMMRDLMMETKGISINELLKPYLRKCSLKL